MLHVLPSMGSVTNYALSWDANVKTIQQCHLEAQRETDEMVEFVQLSNDCALTFPISEKGKTEKTISKWFNARLPLWRRVRELEAQGYRVAHVQPTADGGIEFVTLSREAGVDLVGGSTTRRLADGAEAATGERD